MINFRYLAGYLCLLTVSPVFGAGFAINDKSVSALGQGFAGAAALGEDASALYNNPALLVSLKGSHLALAGHLISTHTEFNDKGSSTTGPSTTDAGKNTLVPNIYYVTEQTPALRAGIGVYSPFGLGVKYDDYWKGRYHNIETSLQTLNISPTLAWAINEEFSIGASFNAQHADAFLKQAIDFGTICVAQLGTAACNSLGLQPQQDDGALSLDGDSWSYGLSLGVAWSHPNGRTRAGAVWHGPVTQEIEGGADFEGVPTAMAAVFTDSPASLELKLPETVSLSMSHAATDRLTVLADYTWTRWSRFDELRVEFDNTLPDSATAQDWNNASRYSMGLSYRLNPEWLLRTGYALDKTPVPDALHRSPRTPDADRDWYTAGFQWTMSQTFSLDMAYALIIVDDADINNTDSLGHTLEGTFTDAINHYLSVQGSWRL